MLTRAQEQLIRSLHDRKGRQETGLCLVEGLKNIQAAGTYVDWTFGPEDSPRYASLLTTDTPQPRAAVARVPQWEWSQVAASPTVVVLDGVQDPGNVGAILRLALAFDAALVLVDAADPCQPKVVRASVGAVFGVPWVRLSATDMEHALEKLGRPVYRLERVEDAQSVALLRGVQEPIVLIAGSEGQGIRTAVQGVSLVVAHTAALESLNVSQALTIALWERSA